MSGIPKKSRLFQPFCHFNDSNFPGFFKLKPHLPASRVTPPIVKTRFFSWAFNWHSLILCSDGQRGREVSGVPP